VSAPAERDVVFNVVWTGTVFPYLRHFVASQLAHSDARFRFVANGCPRDQIELMDRWASAHPGRVVEVLDVSPTAMVAHGVALDAVRASRDDGELFAFIDPDIAATAPFVSVFTSLLRDGCVVVTSGTEVWSDDNLVPVGHPGVAGQHFVGRDGFVFGSPHLAIYDRRALDETTARWGVGLGSAGPELREDARARLEEIGQTYLVYDTAKIVNALLQADGHRLVHRDLPQLLHIGGLSHYLAPSGGFVEGADGELEPDWARWGGEAARLDVARFTALMLRNLCDGGPPPEIPPDADPAIVAKLELVRDAMTVLVAERGGS
jgi:hypothetical protein